MPILGGQLKKLKTHNLLKGVYAAYASRDARFRLNVNSLHRSEIACLDKPAVPPFIAINKASLSSDNRGYRNKPVIRRY